MAGPERSETRRTDVTPDVQKQVCVETLERTCVYTPAEKHTSSPYMQVTIEDVQVRCGEMAKFHAIIEGDPLPVVSWFKGISMVTDSERAHQFNQGTSYSLVLYNTGLEDGGVYTCIAKNSAGEVLCKAELVVQEDKKSQEAKKLSVRRKLHSFYEVKQEIGRGSFGFIKRVVHKDSRVPGAAKFIPLRSKTRAQAYQERDLLASLSHDRIVRLLDEFETRKTLILILELCSNEELLERLFRKNVVTEAQVKIYIKQLLEGIAYLHDNKVLHLDIKPSNILMVYDDQDDIKICDFGFAQKINPAEPQYSLYGSPEFVSPEILSKSPVSTASDIWPVGVISYLSMTCKSPFAGENDRETLLNIQNGRISWDSPEFVHLSKEAKDFITKMLQPSPLARPTAMECLSHPWFVHNLPLDEAHFIDTKQLKFFVSRSKWQRSLMSYKSVLVMRPIPDILEKTHQNTSLGIPRHLLEESSSSSTSGSSSDNEISTSPGRRHFGHPPELHLSVLEDSNYPEYEPFVGETKHPAPLRPTRYKEALARGHLGDPQGSGEQMSLKRQKRGTEDVDSGSSQDKAGLLPPEGAESGRSPGCIPRHSVIKSTFYSQPSESFVNVPSSPGKEHRKHLERAKRTYRKAGYSKSALSGLREPLLEQFGEDEEGISDDEGTERFREAGIGPLMIKSASFDTAQKSPRLTFQVSNRSRSLDDYRMKTASFAEEQYIEEEEGDLIPQSPLSEAAGEESSKKMSAKESAKTLVEISMVPSMALPQAADKQRSVWAAQQQEKMLSSAQPEEKEEGPPQKPSLSAQKGRPVPGGEGLILTMQPSAVSPKMSAEKPEIKEGQLPQTKPTSTQHKEGLAAFQAGSRTDVKLDLSQGTCKSGAQLPEIPSAGGKMEEIVRAKGKSTATLQIVPTEEGHGWLPQMPFVETKMASGVPFSEGQTFALSATEDKGYQMVPQKPSPSTILTSVSLKGKSPVTSPVKPALISVWESESQQLLYQAPAIPRLLKLPDGKGGGSVSTETVPGVMSGTQIQEPSDSSGLVSSVLQSAKSVIQTVFPVDASHISASQDRSQRDLSSKTQMYMSIPSEVERPPQQAAGIKTWTHEGKYHEHVEQESFVPGVGKPVVFEEAREPLSFISKPSLVGTATSQSQEVGLEESLIWSELPSAIPKSSRPQVLMPSHVRTIPTSHLGTERQEVHYPMAFDPSEVKLVTRKRPGQFVPGFPQAKYEPVSTPEGERPVTLKRTLIPMDERRRKEQIRPKTSVYSDTESEALGNLVEEMVSLSQEMTDLAEVLSDQEGSVRHISPPREMFYQGSQGQTGRPKVRYLVRKGKREGGIGLADPSEEGIIYPGEEDIFIGKKARMSDFGRRFYHSGSQGSDPMDNRMYEIMLVQIQDLSEDMPRPDSKTAKFDISEVEPAFLNLYELYDIVYSPFEFLSFRKAPENLPIKRRFPMSEKAKLAPGLKAHWHQEKKLCVREDIIGGEPILKEEVAAPSPPLERLSIQASRIGKRSDSEGDLPVGSQQMYGAPEDATGKRRSSLQSRLGLFKPFVRSQSMDLAEQSLKKMKESVAHFSRRLTRKTSSDEESRADSEEQKSELQERTSLTGSIKKKIGFPSFSLSSLKIKEKAPSFVEALTDQTIAVGQSLTLSCRTSIHSSPHIEWFKDGAAIRSTERILISSTLKHYQLLTILAATRDDFGTYTCVATNSQGTVSTTCVIRRAEAPSNPSAPDIVEILEDGVQLAWKPVELNTPVTYTVLCKKDDGEWKTLASDISDCCFTVEHLPQGLVYSFRIACVSKAGVGPYSNPTAKVKIGERDQAAFQSQDKEEDKMMAAEAQPTRQTYAFQTEIKRGRFSIIKQCREKLTGNPLAAKIIPYRQEDTETVLQEYHILRRLHHSNIGQLQGAYVSPRHLVLIMELCVGPELLNTLAGRSSYSEVEVRDYLWQILSAVEYLHAQNILHLDLRSENMIITEPNLLKIVDFGNAQFYTPDRIVTVEGCTDYVETMASELLSGKGAVPQTDIWAIGVTAFIMLSAEYPISSEGACDFGRRVKREKIKFNKCYAGLSGRAVSFLQSTLSSNPWRRPTAFECLQSPWLQETGLDERQQAPVTFSTTKLRNFWADRERKRALLCSKYGVMAV